MDIKMPTGCQYMPIDELVMYQKNPKKHTKKQIDKIIESINKSGWGDPIVVCPETNEVLSGNGRLLAAKKLGLEEIPVVYAPAGMSEKQKADLVIASNKLVEVSGYNDNLKILMGMYELNAEDFGMVNMQEELEKAEEEEPDLEFTEELFEEHNYVVLYFDNTVDWQTACEKFNIETKQALDSRAGYVRSGIGRVMRGADVLKLLKD